MYKIITVSIISTIAGQIRWYQKEINGICLCVTAFILVTNVSGLYECILTGLDAPGGLTEHGLVEKEVDELPVPATLLLSEERMTPFFLVGSLPEGTPEERDGDERGVSESPQIGGEVAADFTSLGACCPLSLFVAVTGCEGGDRCLWFG